MSKMSQLHLTLDEQAVELGFEGLGEALMKGYDVDYEKGKLVRRGLGYSETVEYLTKEQEKAHESVFLSYLPLRTSELVIIFLVDG